MATPITQEKREVAGAMLLAGKSYREIARALEISLSTVHAISREQPAEEMERLATELGKRFVSRYMLLADAILESISEADILNSTLNGKVSAAAKLAEKAALLGRISGAARPNTEARSNADDGERPLDIKA